MKSKVKNLLCKAKYGVAGVATTVAMGATSLVAHASESTTVTSSDWKSVIDSLTAQISVSTVVAVLASAAGIAVGFVFLWWGLRKVVRMIMGAVRGGKFSV